MKRTMITLVCAATAFTAFAQDPSPTPPTPGEPSGRPAWGKHGGGPFEGPRREALESLTPAERQQLMAARQKAESDPAVEAARQNAMEAMKAMHEAMNAAMLKADPTIGPILEKLKAAGKEAREERPHRHGKKGEPSPSPSPAS